MGYGKRSGRGGHLEDATPATFTVAVLFMSSVFYFIVEHYFLSSEYYAEGAPMFEIALFSALGALLVFVLLKRFEPEEGKAPLYAILMGLGVGLAGYAAIPRLNAFTDDDGLQRYTYILGEDYVWEPEAAGPPKLDLYLGMSEWWRRFEPGDTYTFELRQGGLGIWQVSMAKIYAEQRRFYDCDGVLSCMTK